jgi:two-component system, NarL family, uhpT operon response regulator UhpA
VTGPNSDTDTGALADGDADVWHARIMGNPDPDSPREDRSDAVLSVAIVDDEEMIRDALEAWLSRESSDIRVTVVTSRWPELMEHPSFPVDVALLDFQLNDGIPAHVKIATLRAAGVATVLISTNATPAEVRVCMDAGALSYLSKSDPAQEMIRAIQHAARGKKYTTPKLAELLVKEREQDGGSPRIPKLSPQELLALTLYASDLPMKSVAARLNVSYDTAKQYIDRARDKYDQVGRGARTKVLLYQRAVEDGLVTPESSG